MGLAGAHRARADSSDVATPARWADGFSSTGGSTLAGTEALLASDVPARAVGGWFLECGRIDPRRKPKRHFASDVAACAVGGWFLEYGWIDPRRKPKRYFASDVPAERRSSHASTTRFAMPASAALPQARGS